MQQTPSWAVSGLAAIAVFGLAACSGSSSGGETVVVGGTPTSNVSGILVDGNGSPLEGIRIEVDTTPGTFVFTDADGLFSLDLAEGGYLLSAAWQNGIAAAQSIDVEQGNLLLDPWQIVTTVSGQVVNGGGVPIQGAQIDVDGDFDEEQLTDEEGRFEMQLPTGQYFLVGSLDDYQFQSFGFGIEGLAPTSLGTLQALTLISGRFLDGFSTPLAGVAVNVFSSPDAFSISDSDGRFEVQVPTGSHPWTATLDGTQLWSGNIDAPDEQPIDLGAQQVLVELAGRVIDDSLDPVQGAEVVVDTAPITIEQTDADGRFQLTLPIDQLQLSIRVNGVVVAQRLVDTENLLGLGIVSMNEIVASFGGDSDFDGLSDEFELEGWSIMVDDGGTGEMAMRKVASDPFSANSDGDALTDDEEFAFKTDPSRADTDGDLLDDHVELFQYLSQPTRADTDGDAMANGFPSAQFLDGFEILFLGTSPTLADTDGDGIDDRAELEEGGTSPLVANLPEIAVEVFGEPVIGFVGTDTVSGETQALQTSVQNDESASTSSNEFNLQMNSSLDTQVKAEASYGWPGGWSGGVEAEATLKAGVNTDYTYHTTSESASNLSNTAEQSTTGTETFEYTAGKIEAAIEVQNLTDITLRYDELEILVFQIDPSAGASGLKHLGALEFENGVFGGGDGILLGPQGSNTLFASNEDLDLSRVRAYMNNPTGLYFRIGNFDLLQLDESGSTTVDYDVVAQNVAERTATLAIDFGDGDVERYAIATNIEREPDGTPLGIRMQDALELLDLQFETSTVGDGAPEVPDPLPITWQKRVLTRLEGFETVTEPDAEDPGLLVATRYWVTLGPGVVDEFAGESVDFEEIRLKPGEAYLLQYVRDEDGDGLTSLQERIYGTSDDLADTDGDLASDGEEVEGWEIVFDVDEGGDCDLIVDPESGVDQVSVLNFDVVSNPRFADVDGDGVADGSERDNATNPFDPDTDGDGAPDGLDDSNSPCTFDPGGSNGLKAWFRFSPETYTVEGDQKFLTSVSTAPLRAFVVDNEAGILDELADRESGLEWTSGVGSAPEAAVWFRRDHPYVANYWLVAGPLSVPETAPLIDISGDRGRLVVPLDDMAGDGVPALAAEAGSGFSIATWVQLDEGGLTDPVGLQVVSLAESGTIVPELRRYTLAGFNNPMARFILDIEDFVSFQAVNQPGNVGFYATVFSTLPGDVLTQHQLTDQDVPGPDLDTNWHHLVLTVRHVVGEENEPGESILTFYRDGSVVSSQTIPGTVRPPVPLGTVGAPPLLIGHQAPPPPPSSFFGYSEADFLGRMDDLRLFDIALDPVAVGELFDEF